MYEYKISKIHNIYDGDTITVDIELGFGIVKKEKFRFWKIAQPFILISCNLVINAFIIQSAL